MYKIFNKLAVTDTEAVHLRLTFFLILGIHSENISYIIHANLISSDKKCLCETLQED